MPSLKAQILLGGADIIDKHPERWLARRYSARPNRVCAASAMYEVGKTLGISESDIDTMFGKRIQRIIHMNDKGGRKPIIALMRRMAAQV